MSSFCVFFTCKWTYRVSSQFHFGTVGGAQSAECQNKACDFQRGGDDVKMLRSYWSVQTTCQSKGHVLVSFSRVVGVFWSQAPAILAESEGLTRFSLHPARLSVSSEFWRLRRSTHGPIMDMAMNMNIDTLLEAAVFLEQRSQGSSPAKTRGKSSTWRELRARPLPLFSVKGSRRSTRLLTSATEENYGFFSTIWRNIKCVRGGFVQSSPSLPLY